MKRIGLGLLAIVASLCLVRPARAQTVSFVWTETGTAVDGFKILSGPASGSYNTVTILPGATTSGSVSGLTVGQTYFFVAEAYAGTLVSGPSNEISTTVLSTDATCTAPLGSNALQIFPTLLTKTGSGGPGSKARLDFQVGSPGSPVTVVTVQANSVALATMTGTDLRALAGMWFTIPTVSGSYPLVVTASNLYGCVASQASGFTITVP
jgi:hypothetical protein